MAVTFWISPTGCPAGAKALPRPTVRRLKTYLVHCDAQGLSKATRARRLSSIRQLYRFAFEEGWRTDNPALQALRPRQGAKPAEDLSEPKSPD